MDIVERLNGAIGAAWDDASESSAHKEYAVNLSNLLGDVISEITGLHQQLEEERQQHELTRRALADMTVELEEAKKDSARLDWLADPFNQTGNVQLPTVAVHRNPHSMRGAIDDAMKITEAS